MTLAAATTLAALRRSIASLETANFSFSARDTGLTQEPLGFCEAAPLAASLHEVAARSECEMAAATGFALPLAACAARGRSVLWIAGEMALAESGALYGPALEDCGLKPERLIRVAAPRERDVLWTMEEGLRCRSVGAVLAEIRMDDVGLIASRRLSLAAGRDGTAAFLLRAMPSDEPVAAAMRWIVGTAPSAAGVHGPGPPRFAVRLTRNRRGSLGSWIVEWNSVEQRFELAADRQPLAETVFDRPSRAATGA